MSIHELMSSSFSKMFHWRWATAWSFLHQSSLPKPPQQTKISLGKIFGRHVRHPGNAKAQTGRPASLEDFFQERQAASGWGVSGCWFFSNVFWLRATKTCLKNGDPTQKKQILGNMDGWMEVWWCPKIFVFFKSYQVENRVDRIDAIYIYIIPTFSWFWC